MSVDASEQLQRLGLTVGRVVSVEDHPGARAPSYRLTVDLGSRGRYETTIPSGEYGRSELEGKQLVCALEADELLVLAAHSHARGLVFIGPDSEVEDGSIVA